MVDDQRKMSCSFCGRDQSAVRVLVAGPLGNICDECVDICNEILFEKNSGTNTAPPSATRDLDGVKADLIRAIQESFPAAPIPDQIEARQSSCEDEYSYVAEFFKDRPWTSIGLTSLGREYPGPPDACLNFMSPEGFRYFLPAYLSIFLQAYEEADVIADAAVFALVPTADPRLQGWQADRFSLFSPAQRQVILRFLQYVRERHAEDFGGPDLEAALDYWHGVA